MALQAPGEYGGAESVRFRVGLGAAPKLGLLPLAEMKICCFCSLVGFEGNQFHYWNYLFLLIYIYIYIHILFFRWLKQMEGWKASPSEPALGRFRGWMDDFVWSEKLSVDERVRFGGISTTTKRSS